MQSFTSESRATSQILDQIGYRTQMVKFRQKVYKKIEQAINLSEPHEHMVLAGSKAEGLSAPYENDIDKMKIPRDFICSKYPASFGNRDDITMFSLDMRYTRPGYTFLQLEYCNGSRPFSQLVRESLVEFPSGQLYLSSDILKNILKNGMYVYSDHYNSDFLPTQQGTHGPSCTVALLNTIEMDDVYALECDCPDYLNSWITRERSYQWPPVHVIWDVFNSQAHVVPVGFPESSTYFLEWRICFTEGEIKLVKSLNDCLIKVLILLRQIARSTLKPLCKDMTSYVMKNVVFWIAETHNYNIFTEDNLLFVLQLALKFLKTCIETGNLSSYMIPERNLLANKLTDRQRLDLCMRIDSLLREGPRIVWNSPKMRKALTMLNQSPEEFHDFYPRRQEAELFMLASNCYFLTNLHTPYMTPEQGIYISLNDDVFIYLHFRFIRACIKEMEEHFDEIEGVMYLNGAVEWSALQVFAITVSTVLIKLQKYENKDMHERVKNVRHSVFCPQYIQVF